MRNIHSIVRKWITRSAHPSELKMLQSPCMTGRKVTARVEEAADACRTDRTKEFTRVEV